MKYFKHVRRQELSSKIIHKIAYIVLLIIKTFTAYVFTALIYKYLCTYL